jgi:23S rRNA pseudouridine2605 synthase
MSVPAARPERIQKVLARAGHGSRRQIESWIEAGRITVNGRMAKLGDNLNSDDRVLLDDKPLRFDIDIPPRVIAYHKPVGELCSRNDPEGRPTIFSHLPRLKQGRWVQVGRLDYNTSGLLLLTTDGELANRLMHPSAEIEREYAVRVLGEVEPGMLDRLRSGVELDDGIAAFSRIKDAGGSGANHWYHVILKEGRKHEVRRLWDSQGLTVSRLKRIRYGPVVLTARLAQRRWRDLDEQELTALVNQAGIKRRLKSAAVASPHAVKRASGRQTRRRMTRRR